jgi:cell division septum initiation protein DivIVA
MTALASRRIGSALASAVSRNSTDDERDQLLQANAQLRARVSKLEDEVAYFKAALEQTEKKLADARRGKLAPAPAERGYRLMSQKDAAKHFGVNQSTISRRIAKGELKTEKVEGVKFPKVIVML